MQLHPDQGSVEDLMERTFTARRHELQSPENTGSIHAFLEEYPFLGKFPQVSVLYITVILLFLISSLLLSGLMSRLV